MRRSTRVLLLVMLVVPVVLGSGSWLRSTSASAEAAVTPPGYEPVRVAPAGISFVLPDDWGIEHNFTRTQVERMAAKDHGLSADALLKLPFSAGWYDVDSELPDRMLDVVVNRDLKGYNSPAFTRKALQRADFEDVTVERARVAGKPAVVARYVGRWGDDDAVPTHHFETYYFVGPKGPMFLNFYRSALVDPDFDEITKTVLDSVRMDAS